MAGYDARLQSLAAIAAIGVLAAWLLVFSGAATAQSVAGDSGTTPPDGSTPLHEAIRRNDLTAVDALIRRGANVKAATRYGVTPIGMASLNASTSILKRLLDAGADPNTATPGGETVLMTAARTGNLDAVTVLLDRGAAVNAHDGVRSQTALMWAVTENHSAVVKALVARGADVNAKTIVMQPRGQYVEARAGGAAGNGIIRQRALPTAEGGMSPLLFAVRDGNTAMMRLLLELGANVNQSSGNHTSPLLIALLNGQVTLASELLDRGANPNLADDYHRGPLFAAIELRNFNHDKYPFLYSDGRDPLELISALLDKGADPNLRSDTTPVHGLMQFDGSWVNFDGQTPFIRAALSGDVQVMRLLLKHNADPNIATTQGSTALMAAAGINWIPAQTYTRSEAEYVDAVTLCLERGANVNATNSLKLAAIHGAANRGWVSIIQILADHGAKLDEPDTGGRTPMTFAEGTFLAIRPPVAKPEAIALLKGLMSGRSASITAIAK